MNRLIAILFCISCLVACTKPSERVIDPPTPPDPPQPPKQLNWLFKYYSSTSGSISSSTVSYDSSGRIKTFRLGGGNDYKVFYQNDTIHHVLAPYETFNSLFERKGWVFIYDANKRCAKVLHKYIESYNAADIDDNRPFFSSENVSEAGYMDSLVYSATGQLIELYSYNPNSKTSVVLSKFIYDSPESASPSRINDYSGPSLADPTSNFMTETVYTYTQAEQPLQRLLWFYAFLDIPVPVVPNLPATESRFFLVMLKNPIRNYMTIYHYSPNDYFQSKNFIYGFNADSTVYSGRYDPDDIVYDKFQYVFEKK